MHPWTLPSRASPLPRGQILAPWLLSALLVVGAEGCTRQPPDEQTCRRPGFARTRRYIEENRSRADQAMKRALAYLDRFTIDPVALRRRGVKGRKKLVEHMDALVALHRYATGAERAALAERFRRVASVTARAEYHDMHSVDETQFKQDATSYLRACYLMEKMGQKTDEYRRQIGRIKPRLDAHLSRRGPHQRMSFRAYYLQFGLALPAILSSPIEAGIIRGRPNPYLLTLNQAYDLTHEVFVPHDYGGRLSTDAFTPQDREYLRRALEVLTVAYLRERNADIVGELLACVRYTGNSDLAVYREGLSFLLASQRDNGSFGDYETLRPERGEDLELDLYLHTTSVVMDILPLAFRGPTDGADRSARGGF